MTKNNYPTNPLENKAAPIYSEINIKLSQLRRQTEDIRTVIESVIMAEDLWYPRRYALARIYKNIMTDAHLKSVIDKRIRAVTTAKLNYITDQGDVLDFDWLHSPWLSKLQKLILESRFHGHSLIEPTLSNGIITGVQLIPRQNVIPELGVICIIAEILGNYIYYREKPYNDRLLEVGEPDDLGLLMQAAILVLYKRGAIADLALYAEMFGIPIRKYSYDPNDPAGKEKAKEAAESQGSAAYYIFPNGVTFDIHDGSSRTGTSVHQPLITLCNDELSVLILGQPLTTSNGEGTGSYALGQIHQDVEEAIAFEDKVFVEYQLNWKFKDMMQGFGFNLPKGRFGYDNTTILPLDTRLEMDLQLAARIPIADAYFYETYGIPIPGKNDVITVKPTQAVAAAETPPTPDPDLEDPSTGSGTADDDTGEENEPDDPSTGSGTGKGKASTSAKAMADKVKKKEYSAFAFYGSLTHQFTNSLTSSDEDLLKAIYDDKGVKFDYDTWAKNRDKLAKGLASTLKPGISYNDPETITRAMMEANLHRFGYDKNLTQVYELNQIVKNPDVKSYADFKKQAVPLLGNYNDNYLKTEYDMAVAVGQNTGNFLAAKKNGMTQGIYRTAGDDRVRPEHEELDGIILDLSDAGACDFIPPLGYNCRCDVDYTDSADPDMMQSGDQLRDIIGEPAVVSMTKNGFLVNRADLKEVFTSNQYYSERLLKNTGQDVKLTKLNDLTPELNGLDPYATIAKESHPEWDVNDITKEQAQDWFKGKVDQTGSPYDNKSIQFEDYRKMPLSFSKKDFETHLGAKYAIEDRKGLLEMIEPTLKDPDEVYQYEYKEGKYSYRYVKFYEGKTMVVVTQIDKKYGIQLKTWFDANSIMQNKKIVPNNPDKEVRRGLLIYKKK